MTRLDSMLVSHIRSGLTYMKSYEKWIVDNLRSHVLIKEKFEKCFSSQFLLRENFGGVSGRRYLVYIFGVRERF